MCFILVNVSSPLALLLTQCTYIYTHTDTHTYIYIYIYIYINYMPIHAYIIPIHIYTHACTHFHICTCAYTHSCACVYHFPSVDGRWDGKGVQDPKG